MSALEITEPPLLEHLLEKSASLHKHLCPRQVLGVRMGLFAGEVLGIRVPQEAKRLLVIVETDGCAADGIAVAANCWVGRRTMRIEDYGKVAATFVDTVSGTAIRIVPHPESRQRAASATPGSEARWKKQLIGYQVLPASELFVVRPVSLKTPLSNILSRPGVRAMCERCQEEILNEREVHREGRVLCRPCAGDSYYWPEPAAAD